MRAAAHQPCATGSPVAGSLPRDVHQPQQHGQEAGQGTGVRCTLRCSACHALPLRTSKGLGIYVLQERHGRPARPQHHHPRLGPGGLGLLDGGRLMHQGGRPLLLQEQFAETVFGWYCPLGRYTQGQGSHRGWPGRTSYVRAAQAEVQPSRCGDPELPGWALLWPGCRCGFAGRRVWRGPARPRAGGAGKATAVRTSRH
jgi:hypothetical protein